MKKMHTRFLIETAGLTHQGKVRTNNEDSFLVSPELNLYCVADGVGGHASGEVASSLAVKAIETYVRAATEKYPSPTSAQGIELMGLAAQYASRIVFQKAQENPKLQGMATTLDAVWIAGDQAFVSHVGDSRVYLYRAGKIQQYTDDHHQGHLALKTNQIKKEDLEALLQKNPHLLHSIWQAVGISAQVAPDAFPISIMPKDLILLCSDGVTKHLSDAEIQAILGKPRKSIKEACEKIIEECNQRGGRDNISVVLVEVGEAGSPTAESEAETDPWISPLIRLDGISQVSFFSKLNQAQLERVSSYAMFKRAAKGDVLMRQGDPARELWVLLTGAVDIHDQGKLIASRRAPFIIGERCLFEDGKRGATVIAQEGVAALAFRRESLQEIDQKHPLIALKIKDAIIADLLASRAAALQKA